MVNDGCGINYHRRRRLPPVWPPVEVGIYPTFLYCVTRPILGVVDLTMGSVNHGEDGPVSLRATPRSIASGATDVSVGGEYIETR